MTKQTIKAGTRILLRGTPAFPGFPGVDPRPGRIARWKAENGPVPNDIGQGGRSNPGWHIVKFEDGGALCVHESGFRVIDNR